jgi:hypothetical protein
MINEFELQMSAPLMFGRSFVAFHSENWILNDFRMNEVNNQG